MYSRLVHPLYDISLMVIMLMDKSITFLDCTYVGVLLVGSDYVYH